MQPTAKLAFLGMISQYRCLTIKQCVLAGLASEQMARRYCRQLSSEGLLRIVPWQPPGNTGRPENMAVPTPRGLREVGIESKPIESSFVHQYHVNACRIAFEGLNNASLGLAAQTRFEAIADGSIWPDAIFTLSSQCLAKELLFFLEVDMGSESLKGKGSLTEKIAAYKDCFRQGTYQPGSSRYRGFRVLLVCLGKSRLQGVVRLCRELAPCPFVWVAEYSILMEGGMRNAVWSKAGSKAQYSILGSLYRSTL